MKGQPHPDSDRKTLRAAFLNGEGSLRQLARRFGIPRRTVENWAADEQWWQNRKNLGGEIVAAATISAREHGQELALTAARLVAHTLETAERMLQWVDTALKRDLDPAEFRQVVAAWHEVVRTEREALGLDQPQATIENRLVVLGDIHLQMAQLADTMAGTSFAKPQLLPKPRDTNAADG